jgi:kynurenine formamidase
MKIEDLAAQLTRARIVDLSKKVSPGGADGPVGLPKRKYEISQFKFPPGELMHNIEMESHISTHVEAPSHFVPVRHEGRRADDISEMPLTNLFGMAVFIDCKGLPAKSEVGRDFLARFPIGKGDIVLVGNAPHGGWDRCFLGRASAEYFLEKKIKMVGVDDTVFPEETQYIMKDLNSYFVHEIGRAHV